MSYIENGSNLDHFPDLEVQNKFEVSEMIEGDEIKLIEADRPLPRMRHSFKALIHKIEGDDLICELTWCHDYDNGGSVVSFSHGESPISRRDNGMQGHMFRTQSKYIVEKHQAG